MSVVQQARNELNKAKSELRETRYPTQATWYRNVDRAQPMSEAELKALAISDKVLSVGELARKNFNHIEIERRERFRADKIAKEFATHYRHRYGGCG